jgi:hypothetical protein
MSHTMSVIAQLPKDMGGAEGKVAYIGTSFAHEEIIHLTPFRRHRRHIQAGENRADC